MGKCVSKHPSSLNLHRGSALVTIPTVCVGEDTGTGIVIRSILNHNDDDYHCFYYKEQDVDEDDDKKNRCNSVNITTTDDYGYSNGKPPQYQMQYFPNEKENEITTAGYGSEIIIKNNSIIYNENGCDATGVASSCNEGLKNAGQNGVADGNESGTGCKGSHPLSSENFPEKKVSCSLYLLLHYFLYLFS